MPLSWNDALKAAPSLGKIADFLGKTNPVGQLGNYDGVFELQIGFEGYTPREGSNPTHGAANQQSVVCSLTLTTSLTGSDEALIDFISGVSEQHPWEYPVIVTTKVKIFSPT